MKKIILILLLLVTLTGCAASVENGSSYSGCENTYNTPVGVLASATGNISGVYDMSGGAWEYVSAYMQNTLGSSGFTSSTISNYDTKYFNIYSNSSTATSYNNIILGDATGELGPFYSYKDNDNYNRYHSTWYNDYAQYIESSSPWFIRGGYYYIGTLSGIFNFNRSSGVSNGENSFRLVLED